MKTQLPPGTYVIGDPCYAFDVSWSAVLAEMNFFESDNNSLFGYPCVGRSTAYGDGMYSDNFAYSYAVDSGVLAIMSATLLERDMKFNTSTAPGYVRIVHFDVPVNVTIECGRFIFNDIIIDTNG